MGVLPLTSISYTSEKVTKREGIAPLDERSPRVLHARSRHRFSIPSGVAGTNLRKTARYAGKNCDPLHSGTKVSNARLGETHHYRDHEGQNQSHTNWHNLTFYDNLAELALTYEQGENIFVEGTLQQRKFTPKDGVTRTVHEVIVRSSVGAMVFRSGEKVRRCILAYEAIAIPEATEKRGTRS